MIARLVLLMLLLASIAAGGEPEPASIAQLDIAAGAWVAVPGSHLASVLPSPLPDVGFNAPAAIMSAWGGGTWDEARQQLLVWGGGHADYSGNEVYGFQLSDLKWVRLTNPSPDLMMTAPDPPRRSTLEARADGQPGSRHTYGGMLYMPTVDKMFAAGGSLWSGGGPSQRTWWFDPAAKTWTEKSYPRGQQVLTPISAWDPVLKGVWFPFRGGLYFYTPQNDTWALKATDWHSPDWNAPKMMALHHAKRKLFVVGGDGGAANTWMVDVSGARPKFSVVTLKGDLTPTKVAAPGIVYDSKRQQLVLWAGGRDLYVLDPDTLLITKETLAGDSPSATPQVAGTYGRFQYVASQDLYIVVNAINENVFLGRRRAAATGSSPPRASARDLPPRTWVPVPLSPSGGFHGGGKHARLAFRTANGRIYLAGGDRDGSDAGQGNVWSYGLDDGQWVKEYPSCGPAGEVAPAQPDDVTWVYDSKRDRFYMMPGYYFGVAAYQSACPGGATGQYSAMVFDPAAKKWSAPSFPPPDPKLPGGGYGGDNFGKFGVYDPVTDSLFRVSPTAWGGAMAILDLGKNRWSTKPFGHPDPNSPLRELHAEWEQAAIDVQGRAIYFISPSGIWRSERGDPIYKKLMRYRIDSSSLQIVSDLPAAYEQHRDRERSNLVFDPRNRVLLLPNMANFDGEILRLFIYHVDKRTWETEEIPNQGLADGVHPVMGNTAVFAETNNAMVLIGGHARHPDDGGGRSRLQPNRALGAPEVFWLYRYR